MTTELEALKPCRACGASCRVETFGPGGQLFTEVTLWMCSRTELFGGSCPDRKGYFSPKAWNTRPIETNSRTGDTVGLVQLIEDAKDSRFSSELIGNRFRAMAQSITPPEVGGEKP